MLKEFFDLKAQQLMLQIYTRLNQKLGYTQNEIDELSKFLKSKSDLEELESNMVDFITKNLELLNSLDLEEESKKPEYKVSLDRQREIGKKYFGKELTIEDLLKEVESRGGF